MADDDDTASVTSVRSASSIREEDENGNARVFTIATGEHSTAGAPVMAPKGSIEQARKETKINIVSMAETNQAIIFSPHESNLVQIKGARSGWELAGALHSVRGDVAIVTYFDDISKPNKVVEGEVEYTLIKKALDNLKAGEIANIIRMLEAHSNEKEVVSIMHEWRNASMRFNIKSVYNLYRRKNPEGEKGHVVFEFKVYSNTDLPGAFNPEESLLYTCKASELKVDHCIFPGDEDDVFQVQRITPIIEDEESKLQKGLSLFCQNIDTGEAQTIEVGFDDEVECAFVGVVEYLCHEMLFPFREAASEAVLVVSNAFQTNYQIAVPKTRSTKTGSEYVTGLAAQLVVQLNKRTPTNVTVLMVPDRYELIREEIVAVTCQETGVTTYQAAVCALTFETLKSGGSGALQTEANKRILDEIN